MFGLSTAIGSFVGGFLGDVASVYNSDTGRINVAQVSTVFGILLSVVLLMVLPHENVEDHYASYMAVLVLMGLTVSWAPAACIGPVFSEIVPEHLRRYEGQRGSQMEGPSALSAQPWTPISSWHHLLGLDWLQQPSHHCRHALLCLVGDDTGRPAP